MTECHVCHVKDELVNLSQVKIMNAGVEEVVYAHPPCIEQHNKDVEKNLRGLDVAAIANFVLDHDIDPDDSWSVECLLRREYPELRKQSVWRAYPKLSKQFIAEVVDAAREKRDWNRANALFETIEETVEWTAEVGEDFIAEATSDLVGIIRRFACEHGDSDCDSALEAKAARYAALLLIRQVAWRKFKSKLSEGHREWEASEESTV
jgi:hypothetical protein